MAKNKNLSSFEIDYHNMNKMDDQIKSRIDIDDHAHIATPEPRPPPPLTNQSGTGHALHTYSPKELVTLLNMSTNRDTSIRKV